MHQPSHAVSGLLHRKIRSRWQLGPSSARDGSGLIVDSLVYNAVIDQLDMKWEEELALSLLRAIDTRKNIPFRYYGSGSAFEYEMIRYLYFNAREIAVER